MRMRVGLAVLPFVLGAGTAIGQTPAQNPLPPISPVHVVSLPWIPGTQGKPLFPAGMLKIVFDGKSAEWTPATLAVLQHKTITVFNEHAKANETYSGVPLIDLLTRLGVPDKPHGEDLRLYLVAEGSDGYEAVYSVAEVNPDVHDATVIVADALEGKPLVGDGPLKLVATGEKRPARWVRNLVAVQVLTAQ
jgi:hypothetical protein